MWFFLFMFNSSFIIILLIFLRMHSFVMREKYRQRYGSQHIEYRITLKTAIDDIGANKHYMFMFLGIILTGSLIYTSLLYAILKHGFAFF